MLIFINIITLCLALLITAACTIRIWRNVEGFSNHIHIHVVLMSFNTVAGMAIGTTFSMLFYYNMLPALLVALLVGYLTGRPLGLFAIVDGLTSGLMGSLMGLMVIPMADHQYAWVVIEGIFVLLMLANYKLVGQTAASIKENTYSKSHENV